MVAQTLTFAVLLIILWTIAILLVWYDSNSTRVVRCKNCRLQQMCRLAQRLGDDGYCSEGERRNDEK